MKTGTSLTQVSFSVHVKTDYPPNRSQTTVSCLLSPDTYQWPPGLIPLPASPHCPSLAFQKPASFSCSQPQDIQQGTNKQRPGQALVGRRHGHWQPHQASS
jgi:hypothetical protein